ncbi:hypothetical protein PIB30_035029 [Stylosanthes scabra]|uniref:Uncharacterized protein n=1 Tax=Stylosanthes scabra TaxID=79078 RepID=A0ABU6VBN0_9FABA|nr:hypothetical protein [Stylosanthes scabra]
MHFTELPVQKSIRLVYEARGENQLDYITGEGTPPTCFLKEETFIRSELSKRSSRFLTRHWRRCRDLKRQIPLMAEPPVNHRQSPPRVDGCTAFDSESNNVRRNRRNRATSSRRRSPRRIASSPIPTPRRAVTQIPSPPHIASQLHIPVRHREHRSAYDIMGIVTG